MKFNVLSTSCHRHSSSASIKELMCLYKKQYTMGFKRFFLSSFNYQRQRDSESERHPRHLIYF